VLLLLAVGVEVETDFSALAIRVLGTEERAPININLAQKLIRFLQTKENNDKDCFFYLDSPLYRWELLSVNPNFPMHEAPVKCALWTLQYLLGRDYTDPRFAGRLDPQPLLLNQTFLPAAYQTFRDTLLSVWSEFGNRIPITQLTGKDAHAQHLVLVNIFNQKSYEYYTPYLLQVQDAALEQVNLSEWMTYWHREALLFYRVLVLDCGDPTTLQPANRRLVTELIKASQTYNTPLILIGSERFPNSVNLITYDMPTLSPEDQKALWNYYLEHYADRLKNPVGALVSQFNLSAEAIQTIATQAQSQIKAQTKTKSDISDEDAVSLLWKLCRVQSRSSLEGLVERIEPKTTWDDLILPPDSSQILRQIIATIRQRAKVYDEWVMGGNTRRGMGITSLFYGPSGTGKTTAAEIIAHDLKLDLYRVDLSQVSSKYIGETEKNLSKVFDAAESS
jgi:ATPase family associated with various cellular activities (AAA)